MLVFSPAQGSECISILSTHFCELLGEGPDMLGWNTEVFQMLWLCLFSAAGRIAFNVQKGILAWTFSRGFCDVYCTYAVQVYKKKGETSHSFTNEWSIF